MQGVENSSPPLARDESAKGAWRSSLLRLVNGESPLCHPRDTYCDNLAEVSFEYNGVLYFPGDDHELIFIGFGPFNAIVVLLVVIMVILFSSTSFRSRTIVVLLEQKHDRMVDEAASRLCLSKHMVHSLDPNMYPEHFRCKMEFHSFNFQKYPKNLDLVARIFFLGSRLRVAVFSARAKTLNSDMLFALKQTNEYEFAEFS